METKKAHNGQFGTKYAVDIEPLIAWQVKVTNLLSLACGEESQHFESYKNLKSVIPWNLVGCC